MDNINRLLTDEEIQKATEWLHKLDEYEAGDFIGMLGRQIAKTQDHKTASIKDQERVQVKIDFVVSVYAEVICMVEVEYRQRLQRIKRRIEELYNPYSRYVSPEEREVIWKEEGLKD